MSYTPKSYNDILRDLRGMVISRTDLNDVQAGSVMNTILSAVAMEIASSERRLYSIRESFFLRGATGADLDQRVAELPPDGISRLEASNASGSVLTITRDGSVGDLTIPAGSLIGAEDGRQYRTSIDTVILDGDVLVENVHIISTTAGAIGNAGVGEITEIISMPDAVVEVTNVQPLTNGADEESDAELRQRASLYLQSLTRCSRSALEFLGISFVSSEGERMRFVNLYEDIEQPAYCELVVDDGSGLVVESVSKVGSQVVGTIPVNGASILYHQSPATAPITTANLTVTRGGVNVALAASDIVSLPERGIVYIKEGVLQAGDEWRIRNYRIYQGFMKELQEEIEGDVDNPALLTGFRAAGTRVVVSLATPQFVTFDVSLLLEVNTESSLIADQVNTVLVELINGLAPNEALYTSALIETARGVNGVRDVVIYTRGTFDLYPNQFPATPRNAIRVNSSSILISNNTGG